jgi:hypothetical protein
MPHHVDDDLLHAIPSAQPSPLQYKPKSYQSVYGARDFSFHFNAYAHFVCYRVPHPIQILSFLQGYGAGALPFSVRLPENPFRFAVCHLFSTVVLL